MRSLCRRMLTLLLVMAVWYVAAANVIAAPPAVQARAYIVMNPETGEVLASRNPDMRLAMASTTKMMTALAVVVASNGSDIVRVPAEAVALGESSAGLVAGEELQVTDLLAALMVASGNDAALTLAIHTSGSEEAFVQVMNRRAQEMGMRNTQFRNAHGLDQDGHYSTVRDLIVLGRRYMAVPELRAIVDERTAVIPGPFGQGTRTLESENDLLDIYPEADGVKTGNTANAGYSLVAHAQRNKLGIELYAAMIGSPSRGTRARDMRALLNWGFARYGSAMVLDPKRIYARVPMRDRGGVTVPVKVGGGRLRVPLRIGRQLRETVMVPDWVSEDVVEGQRMGTLTVRQGRQVIATRPLVAAESVDGPSRWNRITTRLGALVP